MSYHVGDGGIPLPKVAGAMFNCKSIRLTKGPKIWACYLKRYTSIRAEIR